MIIATPNCQYGYTWDVIEQILGERTKEFTQWMRGQTMSICEQSPQRKWVDDPANPGRQKIVETGPPLCDRAHGAVVYSWDLQRFIDGRPIID